MKTDDIIDSIGRIDGDFIKEAESVRSGAVKKRKKPAYWRYAAAAASLAVIVGAVFAWRYSIGNGIDMPPDESSNPPLSEDPEPNEPDKIIEFGGHNWIVLEEKDGKAFILSEAVLENWLYNDFLEEPATWEASDMCFYLNNEFLNSFSAEEQFRIIKTTVVTPGSNDSADKIFLLSVDEARKYFPDDSARQAYNTNGEADWWWLRTPGRGNIYAAYVSEDGSVDSDGCMVSKNDGGIRPAMWIYLTSEGAEKALNEALKPLEPFGYKVTENGEILIKKNDFESVYEPDTFRQYFFGTWKGDYDVIVMDDSEKGDYYVLRPWIYRVNESTIAVEFTSGGAGQLYWIDTNSPDKMYYIMDISGYDGEYHLAGNIKYQPYRVYTKTDAPINEPENGFISRLKLDELTNKYDINPYLFTDINQEEKGGLWLHRDDNYINRPIYLISEEPEKIVVKTFVHGEVNRTLEDGSSYTIAEGEVGVTVTVKKIEGEWESYYEFDQEEFMKLFEIAHNN